MRRPAILGVALLVIGVSATAAYAVFQKTKTVPSNTFTTKADWVAPTTDSSVIAKTAGGTPGYIRQGRTYYVYASVSDTGNPASGVSTVTADVSTITTGQTAAALSSGSFTIGGTTYNYRSGSLTTDSPLFQGTYSYTVTATDAAGNAATQTGFTVTVDNTAPAASDIQTANKTGGTAGKAEIGDTITLTFTETIDPNSILAGWTGASTAVVVRLNDGGLLDDSVTFYNAANSAQLPLGTVDLNALDYASTDRTFGASGTASTMVQSGAAITFTLGTASGSTGTASIGGTMGWTPSATATDPAGNACSTSTKNETGGLDTEF